MRSQLTRVLERRRKYNHEYDFMFDTSDYLDGNVNNILNKLSLKISENTDFFSKYWPNTDQFQRVF